MFFCYAEDAEEWFSIPELNINEIGYAEFDEEEKNFALIIFGMS